MREEKSIQVALAKCGEYDPARVEDTVDRLFEAIGFRPGRGAKVLVKPNLLAATPPHYLASTHPLVVRAVCQYLIRGGAQVQVGDSPTFGKATDIAARTGLAKALADLPVPIVNLDQPRYVRLPFGGWIPVSRLAIESDLIVSVPKLKAHRQMRVTGAVKNVYGCVAGIRKPILHFLHGDKGCRFERMIIEIWGKLPPSVSLMDAVTAMHTYGPVRGEPYPLGLLAASFSPVALDCAVNSILGLEPDRVPIWQTTLRLGLPGARREDLAFPLEPIEAFDGRGFKTPDILDCVSIHPLRTTVNWIKRRTMG